MADTKISALDATNTEALRKKALGVRGCLVGLAGNITSVNATGGYNVPFNVESYDTDGIHDNVTSNNRLTVPSGWNYVRVGAGVYASSISTNEGFRMLVRHFNSAIVQQSGRGLPNFFAANADYTEIAASGYSAPIAVSPGDLFVVDLICNDPSITIESSRTWASMELLS